MVAHFFGGHIARVATRPDAKNPSAILAKRANPDLELVEVGRAWLDKFGLCDRQALVQRL